MGLFRRKHRATKESEAQTRSGHGRDDVQNRQPGAQEKTRQDSDMVMEQWTDVPLGKQKSDGSGERR